MMWMKILMCIFKIILPIIGPVKKTLKKYMEEKWLSNPLRVH